MEKTCKQCLLDKPLADFYGHPFGSYGVQGKCIECTKAAVKANRKKRSEYYQAYDRQRSKSPHRVEARRSYALANPNPRPERDKEKRAARVMIGNAVRDGRIIPSPICEICTTPSEVQGHHDDYSKPMSVLWICTLCHSFVHSYWKALDRLIERN